MVSRNFFESVISLCGKDGVSPNAEMVEFATKELAKIDTKNEKAKNARVAKAKENAPIEKAILTYLSSHSKALANELATACGVSTPKVVAVASKMVDTVKVVKVKIPKVGERNVYSLIPTEQEEVVETTNE